MKFVESLSKYIEIDEEVALFLQKHLHKKEFQKGDLVSSANSSDSNIYFVEKGFARSFYTENNKEFTTFFYKEGLLLANKDTLFLNLPTKNNIEVLEDSELSFFDYFKMEKLCESSIEIANFSRKVLTILVTILEKRVQILQHMSAREKYLDLLNEHPEILQRAPLGMIAGYLGISQETLSRVRSTI